MKPEITNTAGTWFRSLEVIRITLVLKLDSHATRANQLEVFRETRSQASCRAACQKRGFWYRHKPNVTVGQLFDFYKDNHLGVLKARTCRNYRQAQAVFEKFVGTETLISRNLHR